MISIIRPKILNWYYQNKRDLPWRDTGNAYYVWLSEIIMQQTRVQQGTPYFLRFQEKFPTINDLATANEDEVLKLWQGLGYYSRARNLHVASKQVLETFNGEFPKTYDEIITLKGVGSYTAAAISSIVFNEPKAVIDGNVIRVISRIFGIEGAVNSVKTLKEIKALAEELIDQQKPGDFNQAVMEFGALNCTPKTPNCDCCPVHDYCLARTKNLVEQIPFKEKKLKKRNRFFHFIVARNQQITFIEKRNSGDIWEGLYQFPLIEKDDDYNLSESEISAFFNEKIELKLILSSKKHVLSHQDIWAKFYLIEVDFTNVLHYQAVNTAELHTFALPRLIDRFLETFDWNAA